MLITIVYDSHYGHTRKQAEAVAQGAGSVAGAKVSLLALGSDAVSWEALEKSDAIIFGSPTYNSMIWVGLDLMPGNNNSKGSVNDLNRLGSWIGAMAQSNADQGPDDGPIDSDLRTAAHLGQRVATLTRRFLNGTEPTVGQARESAEAVTA
ncbi:flavodoxin domain-containing protein [Pseudomonas gingeri]|uniref:Flavodoxin-like domain-containing protein n=1 Tax=Pseudomonas gingeri TaxID=117681 RepID=A0A7Y8CKK7_9PSED|nr:flavodoxin domain-containing protein [Pseudomonas gingeri]NWB25560.1 hypothetical protein [Pseudomonas gingeri]NWC33274.1 hypothetical protein [Pseudomonas gingeri]NWD08260.1 hypothetical protein [Pseudomonas gingeri]NWD47875.1 hypothetical protein [Pseudomonas gingeri]NWE33270.1 hypothetical protein [Pseudomonas gingeri]